MVRFAFFAMSLLLAAIAPERAPACYSHPATKIALINESLPKSKLPPAKMKEVEALRDKARELAWQGKLADSNVAADTALGILKVKQPSPPAGMVSRC